VLQMDVVLGLPDGALHGGNLPEGDMSSAREAVVREAPTYLRKIMRAQIGVALIELDRSDS
jgi:hypothetical protein